LMHVYDPAAVEIPSEAKAVLGDAAQQAEIDLGAESVRRSLLDTADGRLQRVRDWQNEIRLSVVPLSAGEETMPQIRRLLASSAPRRRVR
jgi:hypothetical protein